MEVLVGCEFSGVVRDAFIELGHDAISCDLLPTESPGPHHEGDIFDIINYPFDLAIFHYPCTHTAVSGSRHFKSKRFDGRQHCAISTMMRAVRATEHIRKTVFEQPVSILSSKWRKPDQIIQPWQFGHGETKATCLWLKGCPPLEPTNIVEGRADRIHKLPPSEDRWKLRSTTYSGIAKAMAEQWGALQEKQTEAL